MRQQFADVAILLRRQANQDVAQVGVGILAVELRALDQAHDRGGTLASFVFASAKP